MSETSHDAALFAVNNDLITIAILVVVVPFITGIILMALRAVEIKKGSNFKFNENTTGLFGTGGLAVSWIASIVLAIRYFSEYVELGEEASIQKVLGQSAFLPGNDAFSWGILLDPLSMIFLVVLTTIATTIHFYASNYMHADEAYTRFFGTLNFFTGSMLLFVLASNLFVAFIAWELLGFSSYLLIGYFWPKKSASSAGRKAFMYNKVGDVSFIFAMGFIYPKAHTFDYLTLANMLKTHELLPKDLALPALFLFGAAIGKSAQIPLLGWLPEAMEGPTPVSALLHSSTMVKAGLYLIARGFFMFYSTDSHGSVITSDLVSVLDGNGTLAAFMTPANMIAWFGTFTALAGGLMALTAGDIKKVLAFSTISQLGYIAMAIGSGGVTAGFFHIISHATFKSLLFLGAGAVIHSVHSQDMINMGGLKDKMPWTYRTMLIGLLGLMGVPLMSGFWSKDAVLLSIKENPSIVGNEFLWIVAVFTAGVTAFYSTKLLILTFFGTPRYDKDHVEPGPTGTRMKYSLIFIASLVVIESIWFTIGAFAEETSLLNFEASLATMLGAHGAAFPFEEHAGFFAKLIVILSVAWPSILAVAAGSGFAYMIYGKQSKPFVALLDNTIIQKFATVFENRFYLDIVISGFVNNIVMPVGAAFATFDKVVIDELIVDYIVTERMAHGGAAVSNWTDENIVDGSVKWISNFVSVIAGKLRTAQTGLVANYARYMMIGIVAILSYFVMVNYGFINF